MLRNAKKIEVLDYRLDTLKTGRPEETAVKLYPAVEKDKWIDRSNSYLISFDIDEKGNVKAMRLNVVEKFKRR